MKQNISQNYSRLNSLKIQKKNREKQKYSLKLPSVIKINSHKHINPNYIIGDILGQGAFAKVRKARRKIDNIQCVIKIYDKFRINTDQRKKSIKNQIEILKNMKNQSIITFIECFQNQQTINIVMEYFSNYSLANYVKQHSPIPLEYIRKITKDITEGIQYLHQQGIAHRDIKPQNILVKIINQQPVIKIIDFGLALFQNQINVKIVGTPQFMPPQLMRKENSTQHSYDQYKADIWSLGMTIYWTALGYFPPKKRPVQFPVEIHPGMQYLLSKMLKDDPQDRIHLNEILSDTWIKPKDLKEQIKRLSKNKQIKMEQKNNQQ